MLYGCRNFFRRPRMNNLVRVPIRDRRIDESAPRFLVSRRSSLQNNALQSHVVCLFLWSFNRDSGDFLSPTPHIGSGGKAGRGGRVSGSQGGGAVNLFCPGGGSLNPTCNPSYGGAEIST